MRTRHEIVSRERHMKDMSKLAKSYLEESRGGTGENMGKFMADIRRAVSSTNRHVVIQYSGKEMAPTGFAFVNALEGEPTGKVEFMFILPKKRGKGLGNAFADGLETLFGERYWDGLLLAPQSKKLSERINANK